VSESIAGGDGFALGGMRACGLEGVETVGDDLFFSCHLKAPFLGFLQGFGFVWVWFRHF
jgi:hypothetical protein